MATYAEIATRLAAGFGTVSAPDNANRVIISADDETADGQTLRSMVFAADQSGIHFDDAYEMVRDALQQIADTEPEEIQGTDLDGLIEIYNAPLMQWLSRNWTLADEMYETEGEWPTNMTELAQRTQGFAYAYVLGAIESNWPADDDTEEEDEEEAI